MTFNWKGKKILVAEDEAANYLFLEKILDSTKVTLIHANNGAEAINLIKESEEIDLVLMDLNMPEMNGFDACCAIKSLRPNLPIIAQTCYDNHDKEQIKYAHFDEFVRKPINISKLLFLLDKYITNPNLTERNSMVY